MIVCLVCDGDPAARTVTEKHLAHSDIRVIAVGTLSEIRSHLGRQRIDVVLIEAMLPDGDGLQFCNEIRSASNVPLLVVTAHNDSFNRVLGLELGADDFIPKPFDPRELIARVRAVIRRRTGSLSLFPVQKETRKSEPASLTTTIRVGVKRIRIDWFERQVCHSSGELVAMSSVEVGLLLAFTDNPGTVLSRATLIDLAHISTRVRDRAVDLAISRLRGKLGDLPSEPAIIATVRGYGYRFLAQIENSPR